MCHFLPGVCRTGVLSFRRVLPPLLVSAAGKGVTFSGAAGVDADTVLWALSERVHSDNKFKDMVHSAVHFWHD